MYCQLTSSRTFSLLRTLDLDSVSVHADDEKRVLVMRRGDVTVIFNFSGETRTVDGLEVAAWDFSVR